MKSVVWMCFLFLAVVASLLSGSSAEIWEGTASNPEGFDFLGKFAYNAKPNPADHSDYTVGWVEVELEALDKEFYEAGTLSLQVMAPSDFVDDYPAFYHAKTCAEKPIFDGSLVTFDKNGKARTLKLAIPGGVRRRFRYLVILNCKGYGRVRYTAHFTRDSSSWSRELGANVEGLNTFYLALLIAPILVLCYSAYNGYKLRVVLGFLHPVMRLSINVAAIFFFHILLCAVHFAALANDGRGAPVIYLIGEVTGACARVVFVMLLILVASGWGISHSALRNRFSVLVIFLIFFILQVASVIVANSVDPALPSLPDGIVAYQYIVTALGFLFWGWFLYTAVGSLRIEPIPYKVRLMRVFTAIYSSYVFLLPTIVFVSILLDPWVRERVTDMVTDSISLVAIALFVALFHHTRALKYFALANPAELQAAEETLEYHRL